MNTLSVTNNHIKRYQITSSTILQNGQMINFIINEITKTTIKNNAENESRR
jgi:hypothetical protein